MGNYLNPNNDGFALSLRSEIHVDKSGMIEQTNKVFNTRNRYICVSRPRRFGKSMSLDMLTAYYSTGCNSREMFTGLKIEKAESFEEHLNKYNVIALDMYQFLHESKGNMSEMLNSIQNELLDELSSLCEIEHTEGYPSLIKTLKKAFAKTNKSFVFLIDEWDCIFREHKSNADAQKEYLDFLRLLLKDKTYVGLAYITGILPIKKYGTHSALNMFTEISMLNTGAYAEYTGFTENEVEELCNRYNMPVDMAKKWYNGYEIEGLAIYNPRSVVSSMESKKFSSYWTETETYEALKVYIEANIGGLKDAVVKLLNGESLSIETLTFQNDMVSVESIDDVLTLLVHLGYLTYNEDKQTVRIPNYEIEKEFAATVKVLKWSAVADLFRDSNVLIDATLAGDEKAVAEGLQKAHQDNTSILQYNDENSLACVITLAYYTARRHYDMYREFPTGKGFADVVYTPIQGIDKPAMIIELKCDGSAEQAIEQIKSKEYDCALKSYKGEVILVGINYDKKSKTHTCKIERITK